MRAKARPKTGGAVSQVLPEERKLEKLPDGKHNSKSSSSSADKDENTNSSYSNMSENECPQDFAEQQQQYQHTHQTPPAPPYSPPAHIYHNQEAGVPHPNTYPINPAQSFMWGAHNLFAGLSTVNTRLEALELRSSTIEDQRRRLESLRNFVQSVYRQLQSQNEYVRGSQFSSDVEEKALEVVMTKCLPEILKLRANVEGLTEQLSLTNQNSNKNDNRLHTQCAQSCDDCSNLAGEIEQLVLRLAALGDERIQHIEIVGNGKRYQDGSSIRRMVTEDQLGKESYSHLGIPKTWKSHSDTKTINSNFKQMAIMFNDVLLPRIDSIEESLGKRIGKLEKRVDILHGLFRTLNSPPDSSTEKNKPKSVQEKRCESDDQSKSSMEPLSQKHDTDKSECTLTMNIIPMKQMTISTKSNPDHEATDAVEGENANASDLDEIDENNADSNAVENKHLIADKEQQSSRESSTMASVEEQRNVIVHHQPGAAAGRAAFNRSKQIKSKSSQS